MTWRESIVALGAFANAVVFSTQTAAPLVPVRYPQGAIHGYLVLRTLQGTIVADGDSVQIVTNDLVTTRTVFQFRDGSIDDEKATFSQHGMFRLTRYHHEQRGPFFAQPLTMDIDMATGRVVVQSADHGKPTINDERMALPPDVCNGILITLLQNVDPRALSPTLSFVAATPRPRVVKLVIGRAGTSRFYIGAIAKTATEYVIKTEVGGVTGLFAQLLGKLPPDSHVWIDESDVPGFVKSEAPMSAEGALMRAELTTPRWQAGK